MRPRTLVHLSDLHFGLPAFERTARLLVDALRRADVDHVVVTGDVTNRGRVDELERFFDVFAPFHASGRLTVVPGNHDRLGDDVSSRLMPGTRVDVVAAPGLHLVRVDSTGPHNRRLLSGHGALCREVLARVDAALDRAPAGALTALLLHHHVLPMPEESPFEALSGRLGLPFTTELPLGPELLTLAAGRCDLVLHGHRHVPREHHLALHARPLALFNAGASAQLGRARVFRHAGGRLLEEPGWLELDAADVAPPPPPLAHRVWQGVQRLGLAMF